MREIIYWYYDNCTDYPKNDNTSKRDSIWVSKWELRKYALLNGMLNGHVLSKEAKKFYMSFHKMAIKKGNKNSYICTSAYKDAETSYKSVISFSMGMIAARIVALKRYGIIHLFHIKDKSIEYFSKGKSAPDWFGVDSYGVPFLFESKGSEGSSVKKETIEDAKKQLASIGKIIDKSGSGKTFYAPDFKKHAIISCFRYDKKNNIKDRWYIQDIDPKEEGSIDITINVDNECFKYYWSIVAFLDLYDMTYTETKIGQQNFYFWNIGNEKIGICKFIYDAIKSEKYTEENEYINFYENIKEGLINIKCEKNVEDSSSFEDGIIVCSSEKKFDENL